MSLSADQHDATYDWSDGECSGREDHSLHMFPGGPFHAAHRLMHRSAAFTAASCMLATPCLETPTFLIPMEGLLLDICMLQVSNPEYYNLPKLFQE